MWIRDRVWTGRNWRPAGLGNQANGQPGLAGRPAGRGDPGVALRGAGDRHSGYGHRYAAISDAFPPADLRGLER